MLPPEYRAPSIRPFAVVIACVVVSIFVAALCKPTYPTTTNIAFIGNSIQYYNDFPRLMEAFGEGRIYQNACLRGSADFTTMLTKGSGTFNLFHNGQASIDDDFGMSFSEQVSASADDDDGGVDYLFDFGACSVYQLLLGYDYRLEEYLYVNETGDDIDIDEGSMMTNDGKNACFQVPRYLDYLNSRYEAFGPPKWDYVVMNDNSRFPCCTEQRQLSLQTLNDTYIPLFLETGVTPVFMYTHSYWADERDMSALTDVPTFASLTYVGYKEYVDLVASQLPRNQKPLLAPVGLATLTVWEENYSLWEEFFHYDQVHLSPLGTFLEACIVYATIFGKMPPPSVVTTRPDKLYSDARRMVPPESKFRGYPTEDQMNYVYIVAKRVMNGHIPKSLTVYQNSESVDFVPTDSQYYKASYGGE